MVIHSNGVPDSIAIDPLARNIYWTDPVSDTITVARLDGSARKVSTLVSVSNCYFLLVRTLQAAGRVREMRIDFQCESEIILVTDSPGAVCSVFQIQIRQISCYIKKYR